MHVLRIFCAYPLCGDKLKFQFAAEKRQAADRQLQKSHRINILMKWSFHALIIPISDAKVKIKNENYVFNLDFCAMNNRGEMPLHPNAATKHSLYLNQRRLVC